MIKIGETLTLEFIHSEKDEKFKCKLVEKTENTLYIDYPVNMTTHKTVFMMDGTQLKVSFIGTDGAIYLFESEVIKRVKREVPMIAITFPGKEHLVKIQRRQFVRVETSIDCAVHAPNQILRPFVTVTEDISAGGAAIILPPTADLKENMEFIGHFVLPMQNGDSPYVVVNSRVVRVIEKDRRRIASIQFQQITEQARQAIIRYCFDCQLAMRKKGLDV